MIVGFWGSRRTSRPVRSTIGLSQTGWKSPSEGPASDANGYCVASSLCGKIVGEMSLCSMENSEAVGRSYSKHSLLASVSLDGGLGFDELVESSSPPPHCTAREMVIVGNLVCVSMYEGVLKDGTGKGRTQLFKERRGVGSYFDISGS